MNPRFHGLARLVDSVVGVFNPRAGFERMRLRAAINGAVPAYESAAYGNSVWGVLRASTTSADVLLNGTIRTIRDRCRHAYRNYCTARAVVEGQVAQFVGSGIALIPKTGATSTEDRTDEILGEEFEDFIHYADASGYGSLYEMQRLDIRTEYLAGISLWQLIPRPELVAQGKLPLQVSALNPAQLSIDPVDKVQGAEFRNGIEIDEYGKPIAYHITDDPGNWLIPQFTTDEVQGVLGLRTRPRKQRIPAELILASWVRSEPGQTIGEPQLQPALSRMHDENELVAAELTSAKMGAAPAVAIRSKAAPGAGLSGVGETSDGGGNPFQYFEPGMIFRLLQGEDVTSIENKRPSQLISLFRDMLRGDIAGGTRTSQRWIDRNYSRANYSSMRADNQDAERLVNPEQLRYGRQKMGGLYERVWPMLAIMANLRPPRDPRALRKWAGYELVPDGTPYVNPIDDITAAKLAIDFKLSTYEKEIGKRGGNRRQLHAAWLKEQATPAVQAIVANAGIAKPAVKPTTSAEGDVPATGAETVSDTAMNGAQVQALEEVLLAVAAGQLDSTAAKLLIESAFPYLEDSAVSEMVTAAAATKPRAPAEAGPAGVAADDAETPAGQGAEA